jgi:hypothetical protein
MLMKLTDPNSFLKKAVLLTCLLSSAIQAAPVTQLQQSFSHQSQISQVVDQDKALELGLMIPSKLIEGHQHFTSKSLRGESVRYISPTSEASKVLAEPGTSYAYAARVATDKHEAACVVSTTSPTLQRLGGQAIHYGMQEGSGFITNPYLARLVTTNHEFGHCLDFMGSAAHMDSQANHESGALLMSAVAVTAATKNTTGHIDFDYGIKHTAAEVNAIKPEARSNFNLGVSMMEAYADLQGALQTASATGDLSGFSDFILSFRQGEDLNLSHASGLSVAHILQHEVASGLDVAALKGQSHQQINDLVNQIFMKHFSVNGELSIHSQGFKDIVKDLSIKRSLGATMSEQASAQLDDIQQQTGAYPSAGDKADYVALTRLNLDVQKRLVAESGQGHDPKIAALLEAKDSFLIKQQQELGVHKNNDMAFLKDLRGYESRAFSQASRTGIARAVQEGGLEVNQGKARDLLRSLSDAAPDVRNSLEIGR